MNLQGRSYTKLKLKDLTSRIAIKLVEVYFQHVAGIELDYVHLGEAALRYDPALFSEADIIRQFKELGFETLNDPEDELVEQIRIAAIELIRLAGNVNSLIRNSDYLSERLGLPYDKISRIYSRKKGKTLETFLIQLKIEKAKELIITDKYTLSEISYMLDYSSVQYLSNQFRKVTGITVSQFKDDPQAHLVPIEEL